MMGVALAALAGACLDAPDYYYGESLIDVRFVVWELDMGVHPSRAALEDPNNPFRRHPPSAEMKWQILQYGGDAAAFYAWATLLALAPNGELQFYTARAAERVAHNGGVTEVEVPYVRQIALDGYAAVLEHFPDAVTFDATGTIAYPLAPLAREAIVALGGTPPPARAP